MSLVDLSEGDMRANRVPETGSCLKCRVVSFYISSNENKWATGLGGAGGRDRTGPPGRAPRARAPGGVAARGGAPRRDRLCARSRTCNLSRAPDRATCGSPHARHFSPLLWARRRAAIALRAAGSASLPVPPYGEDRSLTVPVPRRWSAPEHLIIGSSFIASIPPGICLIDVIDR